GTGTVSFFTDSGTFSTVSAIDDTTLPSAGRPPIFFPHGFFDWTVTGLIPGQIITITMTYPSSIPIGSQYWKVIGTTWTDMSSLLGDDDGLDNVITLTITDGGFGDADGLNGEISEPGAIIADTTAPGESRPSN